MDIYGVGGAVVCAVIAALWDVLRGRIPNRLTYGAMIVGLSVRAFAGGWRGAGDGLLAGLVAGGIFFIFFLVRGMGAGDVKLMAAVGCWAGLRQALVILLASAIAGGFLALAYAIFRHKGVRTLRNLGVLLRYHLASGLHPHPQINLENPEVIKIPYALAIVGGTVYTFAIMLLRG